MSQTRYAADLDSLDARPPHDWYEQAKFRVFVQWGLFAIPGFAARPGSISSLALYLASDESAFTTGAVHVIDGGWTA